MRLRDDYVEDTAAGIARWNRVLNETDIPFRMSLPHVAFNRRIGEFNTLRADTEGHILSALDWDARATTMLPSVEDNLFIASLMKPSLGKGQIFASWIAPPRHGIDNMPGDFEYVHIER